MEEKNYIKITLTSDGFKCSQQYSNGSGFFTLSDDFGHIFLVKLSPKTNINHKKSYKARAEKYQFNGLTFRHGLLISMVCLINILSVLLMTYQLRNVENFTLFHIFRMIIFIKVNI